MLVKLFTLTSCALLISAGITYVILSQIDIAQEEPIFYCRVIYPPDYVDYSVSHPLFKQYCSACHKYDVRVLGPALAGIGQRRSRKWIIDWVHDSQAFIASGDSLAIAVFEENQGMICASFPFLTENQIDSLIVFLDQ